MKVRFGFVSNSSSSSFVCPVCENTYDVMDGDPSSSAHLCECENNHAFCVSHLEIERIDLLRLFRKWLTTQKDFNDPQIDLYSDAEFEKESALTKTEKTKTMLNMINL